MKVKTCTVKELEINYRPGNYYIKQQSICNSKDAHAAIKRSFDLNTIACQEQMIVMYLDHANHPKGILKLSKGGVSSTVADIRLILSVGLKCLASSFIIAHNHPSGNLDASEQDKRLTRQIFEAGKLVELLLIDHLIVGPNLSYSSFKDEGIL